MFKKVDPKQSLPKMEEEILKFWEDNKIFEKSVEIRKNNPAYVFYDGPPFATGMPHYGHILTGVIKDAIPRYWTMRGRYVERKWGWDCHGLPIENIVEKSLGIKRKKDIKKIGIDKFNETCRSKVSKYVEDWKSVIKRLGRWADMENSYKTMDLSFMESVWWVFKELWNKGLIYEGYRSMYICTRCETTLSQQDVADGYKDIKDLAVTVKFKLENEPDTYLLVWTTTPWTLIGNTAVVVGEKIAYVKVKLKCHSGLPTRPAGGDPESNKILKHLPASLCEALQAGVQDDNYYILAKERIKEVLKDKEFEVINEFKGRDLIGKEYKPLFDYYINKGLDNEENGWKVYPADFLNTEEGTGIVHIAPAFGEDDLDLSYKHNLPFIQHVGMDGLIKKEAVDFAGMSVKPMENHQKTDIEVIKFLEKNNCLFSKEEYLHSYPHCWRCETPLINYATSSWFVNVTKIKGKALELAKDINWVPSHIKEGRFGNWLEGARDWSISRQRFWASVIPIWKCNGQTEIKNQKSKIKGECENIKVIGSVKELEKLSGQKVTDLHKHIIDKIIFKCEKCGGIMKRIPDVLDTWFDSGSMPYAQVHYPFENKEKFEANFPAEFIGEGIDQTRAWFYYLHIISTAIKEKPAYKNVVVNGIVLDEQGKKMSKRLQNYPDPAEIFRKYGADILRFYLLSSPVMAAEDLSLKETEMTEFYRGMFRMLWNSYYFFVMYANVDKFKPTARSQQPTTNLLDKWIISELNVLIREVNENMEKYELNRTARLFPKFVDNLSNWYIRRSRRRFWKPARIATRSVAGGSESDEDKKLAYETLHYVLVTLAKLMAPFTPFIAEEIYKNLTGEESVHLADFPIADEKLIDKKLNRNMNDLREIISLGLQERARHGKKVRQPLAKVILGQKFKGVFDELINKLEWSQILTEELNVKGAELGTAVETLALDTRITKDLKLEGQAREIIRHIQEMRKEAGYEVDNHIKVGYIGASEVFEKFGEMIGKEVLADELKSEKLEKFDLEKEF
ncbi:MAG: class I tRNA ligase family protein, partial [Candidatus Moranbacteria bacterium]|nr:class I tRNA ligase family protein [Candidatus Moranbacteria bacterium]